MSNTNEPCSNQQGEKRERFASLETNELDNLLEAAQSKRTKYNTVYAISVYKGEFVFDFEGCQGYEFSFLIESTFLSEWALERKIGKELH